MSTRATYQFVRRDTSPTFYIHYDGYPVGGASYLAAAIARPSGRDTRGGLAEAFLRANELAELTRGHDAHGDTEYRYTIDEGDGTVRVLERTWGPGGYDAPVTWRPFYIGPLADFLNNQRERAAKLGPGSMSADLTAHRFVQVGARTATVAQLTHEAREEIAGAERALSEGWTGNASSYAHNAALLFAAGAEIPADEIRALLERATAAFPHMLPHYLKDAGLEPAPVEEGAR